MGQGAGGEGKGKREKRRREEKREEKKRFGNNGVYFSILPKASLQAGMINDINLSVLLKLFCSFPDLLP